MKRLHLIKKIIKYKLIFSDHQVKPAVIDDRYMFPEDARLKNLTYSLTILATIQQIQEIHDVTNNTIKINNIGEPERNIEIAKIPIMVGSNYCNTKIKKDIPNSECKYDPIGFFIVKGAEKVIIPHENIIPDKILIIKKKDITYPNQYTHVATIQSKNPIEENIQILNIKIKKDMCIYVQTVMFNEVPLYIFLRAYGLVSDKQITDIIIHDFEDNEMFNYLKYSINNSIVEDNKTFKTVKTQEQALIYLMNKLRTSTKFENLNTDEDEEILKKKY